MSTLKTGDSFAFRKTITVAEQAMFTGISGNLGGLYVDATRARALGAPAQVAFELIAGAMASTALNRLTGPEWRLRGVSFEFPVPVHIGNSIEARAEVTALSGTEITCAITCTLNPEGTIVATGRAQLVPYAA
ncbi:hypothetical protein [Thioclava sp. GXIMD2076]|uniref:hypothetical protein n=1 Tax=Thioclava sp. GXIMD2076 TaxID=3131931 RepID=UPI0030CD5E43